MESRASGRAVGSSPVVSVLTPSYNQGRWLPDNLRSVAAQSYPAIEHVVMDGASTDGSVQILADAAPAIIWETGRDRGQSDAINKAFNRSTGDIIGWLNSDDAYFSSDVVATAVSAFDKHPEAGMVYGHAVRVNGAGNLMYVLWTPSHTGALLRAGCNPIRQPAAFVRRAVIERQFFVDPDFDYMMDRELWLYLSTRTRFRHINRIMAVDRQHPQRKSYARPDLIAPDRRALLQRYGIPTSAPNRVLRQAVALSLRLAGLSKIREASRGSDVLSIEQGAAVKIAARQIIHLERWAPEEE